MWWSGTCIRQRRCSRMPSSPSNPLIACSGCSAKCLMNSALCKTSPSADVLADSANIASGKQRVTTVTIYEKLSSACVRETPTTPKTLSHVGLQAGMAGGIHNRLKAKGRSCGRGARGTTALLQSPDGLGGRREERCCGFFLLNPGPLLTFLGLVIRFHPLWALAWEAAGPPSFFQGMGSGFKPIGC